MFDALYHSDGRKMMINLPPGPQITVNFLTDRAIKHRKIAFPPQAPVPSDIPIMPCQVHSSTIPDILSMTSLSTACASTPQPSASTRNRDAPQPRVTKRLARARCIKFSPAQAKVKKRSSAAINNDEPPLLPAPILLLSMIHVLLLLFSPPSLSVKPCAHSYPVSALANLWYHTCKSPSINLNLVVATLYITAVPPANQGSPHENLGRTSAPQFQSNPLVLPAAIMWSLLTIFYLCDLCRSGMCGSNVIHPCGLT